MSTLNTITSQAWEPFSGNVAQDFTIPKVDILQTSGAAKATQGGLEIFADPLASDNFFLNSIQISFHDATNGSVWSLYVGKDKICTFPTLGAGGEAFYSLCFGEPGAAGDVTTTTASVSLFSSGGTATVDFYALGKRKR